MPPLPPGFLPRATRHAGGFSLLQLVVYASASGFLLTAAAAALLSSLRSNASMEAYQRAEERWSRLSHLIQSEASEASEVLYGQSLHCAGSSGNADVTLRIPYVSESGGVQSEAMALVQYYKVGSGAATELRRCGAPYLADGRLNFASPSRDTRIALHTDLLVENPAIDAFTFTLTLYSSSDREVLRRTGTASVGVEPVDPG
jgi:hypothetical protein